MELKAGWLDRQFEKVNQEVRDWPSWMQREAGFTGAQISEPETKVAAAQSGAQQAPKDK
jgi:hypothetical protein